MINKRKIFPVFFCFKAVQSLDIGRGMFTEAALKRCSYKSVSWKHAANLEENNHAEVWFHKTCETTLLKSHFTWVLSWNFATYFQNKFPNYLRQNMSKTQGN